MCCFKHSQIWLWWWFLGAVVLQQQTPVSADVTCKLNMEGYGTKPGLKAALLSCTGGSITAAAHPLLLGPFTHAFSGVRWSKEGDCGDYITTCVLTICASSTATFKAATVTHVKLGNSTAVTGMLVCAGGRSKLVFESSRFHNNTGRPLTAVEKSQAEIHIKGSSFLHNTLLDWPKGAGAALYVGGGITEVKASTFRGNSVQNNGGAVAVTRAATLNMASSLVENNTAGSWGGGVYAGGTSRITLDRCGFTGNTAEYGGGMQLWDNATGTIFLSNFTKNKATQNGGGVAAGRSVHANITMGLFVRNTAGQDGGGLVAISHARVQVTDTQFRNGSASYGGGLCANDESHVTVEGSLFESNTASTEGGAVVLWHFAIVHMSYATIINNTAPLAGGINVAVNSTLHLRASELIGNTAVKSGGAAYVGGDSNATVTGCVMANNSAQTDNGGGMVVGNQATLAVRQTRFLVNRAWSGAGGALYTTGLGKVVLDGCNVSSNVAKTYGGGLNAVDRSNVSIIACLFDSNSATSGGGAIGMGQSARVDFMTSRGKANRCPNNGGFLSIESDARVLLVDAAFDGNWVRPNGRGGLLQGTGNAIVVVKRCDIAGGVKQPNVYGGAFHLNSNATLHMFDCTVSGVHAGVGAGIAAYDTSSVHTTRCTMHNLTAIEYGAGMFLSTSARSTWVGGRLVQLKAPYGAAASVWVGKVAFTDTDFSSALATSQGGALYVENDAAVSLHRCRLRDCVSDGDGGAMFVTGTAHVGMEGCYLVGCKSVQDSGGAIAAASNATVDMFKCHVSLNIAAQKGGGVAAYDNARVRAVNCEFSRNRCAGSGGALEVWDTASLTLDTCVVTGNRADNGGGLVLNNFAQLSMNRSRVTANVAEVYGGGANIGSANFSLSQVLSSVVGNVAPVAADVSAAPKKLRNTNSSQVKNFVSRLGSEGLVNVTLQVTGPQGLSSAGVGVLALVEGAPVGREKSGGAGYVRLSVPLRRPPGTYSVRFTVPDNADVMPVDMTVQVVGCGEGNTTSSTKDFCQRCDVGYYSFNPNNSICDHCVSNAQCSGGAVVLPSPGFWHSATHSVQMHRCFNQEACPGGNNNTQQLGQQLQDYKSAQCKDGYGGNLCAICQPAYGTVKPFTCKQCMKPAITITLYTLAGVVMLVAVRLLSALALADVGRARMPDQAKPVDLLKPLVIYGQWLYIIMQLNGIPWPLTLAYPVQALGWFWSSASSNSLGLDCVLPRGSGLPVAIQKLLFGLLMPLAILAVLLCCELFFTAVDGMLRARRGRLQPAQLQDRFLSLCLCMAFLFLPTWTHAVFSLFTCVRLDDAAAWPYVADAVGSYWAQDMAERCYSTVGYHRRWAYGLGIPLLVLLCFVLPTGLFVFLWVSNQRGQLARDDFRKHFGFLYRTWREGVCWWESVVVLQTIVLVMIGTFGYALGPYYQALVITAALAIVGVLLMSVRPHQSTAASIVSLRSIGVLMTTAFSALTFLPYNGITPAPGYTMAMGVFVLVMNASFVVSTLWMLLRIMECSCARRVCGVCYGRSTRCLRRHQQASRPQHSKCVEVLHLPLAWLHALVPGCCTCCSMQASHESAEQPGPGDGHKGVQPHPNHPPSEAR